MARDSLVWRYGVWILAIEALAGASAFVGVRLVSLASDPHAPLTWPGAVIACATLGCVAGTLGVLWVLNRRLEAMLRRISERIRAIGADQPPDPSPGHDMTSVDMAIRRTERDLARRLAALNARRQEAETILGSMADAVIALDQEQVILSINPAAEHLLGVSADQAKGRLLQEAALEPSLNAFVTRALSRQEEETAELEFTGEQPIHVQAMASPLEIVSSNTERGVLLVLTDVTRLRRLEQIRSDFAANVSHELRTPITNIKGYVETLIQTGLEDKMQAQEFLAIIQRNSLRLGAIVDDIMALTRIEQAERVGAVEVTPSLVRSVLEAASEELAPEAGAKDMTIEIRAPEGLVAHMNPDLVEQAVSNLLSNAVRYSKPGTRVTVRAVESRLPTGEKALRIEVKDEGPGIAPEHLPRLFERFYRVDKARSRGVGGTGLGLAIVKHIAQAHAGSVEVRSKPGAGSTFSIVLPLNVESVNLEADGHR